MTKIAIGAAMLVGAATAFAVAPYLAPVIITNSLLTSAVFGVGAAGASVTFGGIEQALHDHCHTDGETKAWSDNTSCIAGIRSAIRWDFVT